METVDFKKKFFNLPKFNPQECQSPSAISVPSSPRVFQNYRKKGNKPGIDPNWTTIQNPTEDGLDLTARRVTGEEETEPESISAVTPQNPKLVGGTFFGPDFNLEAYRQNEASSASIDGQEGVSPRTPKTPGGGKDSEKGHRKVLEQRRQLVTQLLKEQGLFPSTQATSAFQVI